MARLLNFFKKDTFSDRLIKIQSGDSEEREKLIQEYIPFVIKTISNHINRYLESENSEEYSIGLEAFNEALDKYEASRGSFIGFAELVIKSRITDYLRKIKKHSKTLSINQLEESEENWSSDSLKTEDFTEKIALKEEIQALEKQLKAFDITFQNLVEEAPKHRDTRSKALEIAGFIVNHQELRDELMRKKNLPSSRLVQDMGVTIKMLKRSRKFIIATVLILDSELDGLKQYISGGKGGVSHGL
ncbi:RNA polymerase sigma-I factor [Geosporobacter ferrireducens]|uniref:RNA polymerase sigma factor SigI n=1 Tax=Geosporobacter ferrireducens TaxID=1424294 RepID=A0A1D8GQ42_9FIRM|nr:RNA polymerase sigma-I factor [Geosporobacter ferrireducens]AOT73072.1 RNA polymerase sigma-I factor [Geosporobacter ferrireducens]